MRVQVVSLGCRVNQAEAAELRALLLEEGHPPAEPAEQPDLVVVVSCTVTAGADRDMRRTVRRAAALEPSLGVVVVGCLPQGSPEPPPLPGLVGWLGTADRWELPRLLEQLRPGQVLTRISPPGPPEKTPRLPLDQRARGFVAVQTGCNQRCAYCIVPRVRGPERSRSLGSIRRQVEAFLEQGRREMVLCGTHLGRWGTDLTPPTELTDLVDELLSLDGGFRLRLSSLDPEEITPGLLDRMSRSTRISPHLHLPLQSGSETVLRRMDRGGSVARVVDVIREAARLLDRPALGADLMVGFPGECPDEFQETLSLVEELPLTYLHVFAFSPRPGTPAADRPGRIPREETRLRSRLLRELGLRKGLRFRESLVGLPEQACILGPDGQGRTRGLVGRFVEVLLPETALAPGSLTDVTLTGPALQGDRWEATVRSSDP